MLFTNSTPEKKRKIEINSSELKENVFDRQRHVLAAIQVFDSLVLGRGTGLVHPSGADLVQTRVMARSVLLVAAALTAGTGVVLVRSVLMRRLIRTPVLVVARFVAVVVTRTLA